MSGILLLVISIMAMSFMTSCETMDSMGVTETVKAAAKEWIIAKIDELGVKKTSPVLVVEATEIVDPKLKAEVLSQLNASPVQTP